MSHTDLMSITRREERCIPCIKSDTNALCRDRETIQTAKYQVDANVNWWSEHHTFWNQLVSNYALINSDNLDRAARSCLSLSGRHERDAWATPLSAGSASYPLAECLSDKNAVSIINENIDPLISLAASIESLSFNITECLIKSKRSCISNFYSSNF